MCNRTHWSLSPFMLQADGFCSLMKKDHDLAHAGRFIRFNIAIGKASISTSKNKKGYKTRSTRNDIAHVNEEYYRSVVVHQRDHTRVRAACVRYMRRYPKNQV